MYSFLYLENKSIMTYFDQNMYNRSIIYTNDAIIDKQSSIN